MKILLLVFTAMVMTAMGVYAQKGTTEIGPSNYHQLAQVEAAVLTKKLSLTAAQKDSVLQIYETYFKKISDIRRQQLSNEEMEHRMRLFQNEWTGRLQRVLSDSQYRHLQEDKEQARKRADSLRAAHFKQEGH